MTRLPEETGPITHFFATRGATVRHQPDLDDLRSQYLVPNGIGTEPVMAYEHLIEALLAPSTH